MRIIVFAVCLSFAASAFANDAPPQPADYAFGFALDSATSGIYELELPLSVYRAASDARLRDAGVFNANGEPVPRLVRPAEDRVVTATEQIALPMLAVYSNQQAPLDNIRMLVRRGNANAELSFDGGILKAAEDAERLSAYLIDIREHSKSLNGIAFQWPDSAAPFLGKVRIQGSNDLVAWRQLAAGALASLQEADAEVLRNTITLNASGTKFLRVLWEDMPENWSLTSVSGLYPVEQRSSNRQFLMVDAAATDESNGKVFELDATLLVDRVAIVLAEAESALAGDLYYRQAGDAGWRYAQQVSVNNFSSAAASTEVVKLAGIRTSALRFVPSSSTEDVAFALRVGWRPDTMLFLARGPNPFQLVVGNAADAERAFPLHRDYADRKIFSADGNWLRASPASLGSRQVLGGLERLQISKPTDWRQFILWFVLLAGVAFAGMMALRLVREMKSSDT